MVGVGRCEAGEVMGGTSSDAGAVTTVSTGSILERVRVAGKPAFAVVIAAIAFLAQDLFQRITGIVITSDEGIAFVIVLSWLAYWLVPTSAQDAAPPATPPGIAA